MTAFTFGPVRRRAAPVLFAVAVLAAAFAAGAAFVKWRPWPYDALSARASEIAWLLRTDFGSVPELVGPRYYDRQGATVFDRAAMSPGPTLLSGIFAEGVGLRLIDADGAAIARWPVDFFALFPDTGHVRPPSEVPRTRWSYHVQGMVALPDGAVVFNIGTLGLVKLDRCGDPVWTLARMTHHSVAPLPDGGFWVPAKGDPADAVPDRVLPGLDPERVARAPDYDDRLLRISAEGRVIDDIPLLPVLLEGGLWHLLFDTVDGAPDDPTHVNDIEPVTPAVAARLPGASVGDIVISARSLDLIAVVDPIRRALVAAWSGPWVNQHDPDPLPDGRLSVFDNNRVRGFGARTPPEDHPFGGSAIRILDPADGSVETALGGGLRPGGGTGGPTWYTGIMGTHQHLPNGNLLITESMRGRVFEVAPDGAVVWEVVEAFDERHSAVIEEAIRYPAGYFDVSDWSCPDRA